MSYESAISWTDSTWNPVVGCSKISAGCANCYAERMARRQVGMGTPGYYSVMDGTKWNGKTVLVNKKLTKPLHWKGPRKIFVCSMGDLFHESVPFEWVLKVVGIIIATPWHTYKILTKRPKRMYDFFASFPDGWLIREGMKHSLFGYEFFALHAIHGVITDGRVQKANKYYLANYDQSKRGKLDSPVPHPIPNLHLGVTVENQKNVGRIADLIRTPAAQRFVSFEPLLGRVHAIRIFYRRLCTYKSHKCRVRHIDYAVIGCESGRGARLCTLDDIRYVMQQCRDGGVKVHVKQIPLNGQCNKNFDEWSEEFRVREV